MLAPTGEAAAHSVRNSEAGFEELLQWLKDQRASLGTLYALMEASGGYEAALARFLHRQGLAHVSVINPRRLSAYAQSQLRRSKTDRADARLLARFCQREADKLSPWQPPEPDRTALREMTRGFARRCTSRP